MLLSAAAWYFCIAVVSPAAFVRLRGCHPARLQQHTPVRCAAKVATSRSRGGARSPRAPLGVCHCCCCGEMAFSSCAGARSSVASGSAALLVRPSPLLTVSALRVRPPANPWGTMQVCFDSTLRKRARKMNKHKYRCVKRGGAASARAGCATHWEGVGGDGVVACLAVCPGVGASCMARALWGH